MDGEGIKQVETVAGDATAQRAKGTVVPLAAGAPFYAGDVLQTVAEASLGIFFGQKTLSLGKDCRFLLYEFVYDSGSKWRRWTRISSKASSHS